MKKKLISIVLLVLVLFTVAFAATACNKYNKNVTVTTETDYGYTMFDLEYTLKVKSGTVYEVQFTMYYLDGTARKSETFTKIGEWTAKDSPYTINYRGSFDNVVTITKVIANVTATSTSNIAYAIVPAALAFVALVWLAVALVLTLVPKKAKKVAAPNSDAEQTDSGATSDTDTVTADTAETSDDTATPKDE